MSTQRLSRRALVLAGVAATAAKNAVSQQADSALTAGEIIDRVKANVGVPWRERTVDNIIAGASDTPVRSKPRTACPGRFGKQCGAAPRGAMSGSK